jgi:secreted PhoX family phosphatase
MTDSIGYTDGDIDTNMSANPTFEEIAAERYSRRQTLLGGISAATVAVFGSNLLAACNNDPADTEPPKSNAGTAVSTSSGKIVTLAGTASDNNSTLSLSWTQIAGPTVTLTGANTNVPTFQAPSVAATTQLQFRLNATDGSGNFSSSDVVVNVDPAKLDFVAVPKSQTDVIVVPTGYSVTVLYRLGDPIAGGVAAFANDGTDTNYAQRAGDHHDGMSYFGLNAAGTGPDNTNNSRGLLVMNHENINQAYLHTGGATSPGGVRPTAEVVKEIECHGVSVVEITRASGAWTYTQGSAFNRRITPFTPTTFSGPVRGSSLLFTNFSPTGTDGRGTVNNCANGYMPWGTYLTCEENWAGYFRRDAGDNARRTTALGARAITAFTRYGLNTGAGDSARAGNFNWSTAAPTSAGDTRIAKFNASVDAAAAADGTGDFRNEPNQYGWVLEIDPFTATSIPRKRTALGRMNHEGCCPGRVFAGVKPAFYMGDDATNEYIYKFVSSTAWSAADATPADRLATGDKYLNAGTLYVARFNADGTGQWLPLIFGSNGLTNANATYPFVDQADVLTHARLAADVLGATKMDRPEWTAVNPVTGEMYCTLTNNSTRTVANTDAANPRAYTDPKTTGGQTNGNANGHIIRLRETGDTTEALAFTWDIYAFGAGSDLDAANVNLSGLNATNDFSSPDGLWFGRPANATGMVSPVLWIETDDGAYTDVTNCMLLAAMPGTVNDGAVKTITNTIAGTSTNQSTRVGKAPGTQLRRFLVGCKECEITGIDSTPDGRTVFVNIQHPGENGNPGNITSNWPASQATGSAPGNRPRSATIAITKNDGGIVAI